MNKTDSPEPGTPGGTLPYTITVSNAGPNAAASMTMNDPLPPQTTFTSIPPPAARSCTKPAAGSTGTVNCTTASFASGATATFTLGLQLSPAALDGSTITTTSPASSTTADANTGNNSATATTTVRAEADLAVTKTDSPDPVRPGGTLTYIIGVSNAGPNAAASVTMNDPLPPLTTFQSMPTPAGWSCTTPAAGSPGTVNCTTATLASGATATFTLAVQVSPAALDGSTIANAATVSSATFDPNLMNNTATATTSVRAADLAISKSAPADATSGTDITYHLTVTSNGPTTSTGGTVTDILPAGVSFQSAPGCTFTSPSMVSCTFGTPAAGPSVSLE